MTKAGVPLLDVSLPIGISFYTFQAMSYPIDVYRSDACVQRSFVRFGAFVTLFPQLIAGPIIRYKDVADQLNARDHSAEKFSSGVLKFTVGLCKKVLLANNIGRLWDATFALPVSELSALGAVLGVLRTVALPFVCPQLAQRGALERPEVGGLDVRVRMFGRRCGRRLGPGDVLLRAAVRKVGLVHRNAPIRLGAVA